MAALGVPRPPSDFRRVHHNAQQLAKKSRRGPGRVIVTAVSRLAISAGALRRVIGSAALRRVKLDKMPTPSSQSQNDKWGKEGVDAAGQRGPPRWVPARAAAAVPQSAAGCRRINAVR